MLSNSSSFFPLISISSSSSEILSSSCSSLLEWPSIFFYISVSFFFPWFSISWVTSSLILSIFILNSFLYLWCSLFHFIVYLGLLLVHFFVCVFSYSFFVVVLEFFECLLYVLVDHVQ
jgi:hypothetical protein